MVLKRCIFATGCEHGLAAVPTLGLQDGGTCRSGIDGNGPLNHFKRSCAKEGGTGVEPGRGNRRESN